MDGQNIGTTEPNLAFDFAHDRYIVDTSPLRDGSLDIKLADEEKGEITIEFEEATTLTEENKRELVADIVRELGADINIKKFADKLRKVGAQIKMEKFDKAVINHINKIAKISYNNTTKIYELLQGPVNVILLVSQYDFVTARGSIFMRSLEILTELFLDPDQLKKLLTVVTSHTSDDFSPMDSIKSWAKEPPKGLNDTMLDLLNFLAHNEGSVVNFPKPLKEGTFNPPESWEKLINPDTFVDSPSLGYTNILSSIQPLKINNVPIIIENGLIGRPNLSVNIKYELSTDLYLQKGCW